LVDLKPEVGIYDAFRAERGGVAGAKFPREFGKKRKIAILRK
jgi:hypothetical protein